MVSYKKLLLLQNYKLGRHFREHSAELWGDESMEKPNELWAAFFLDFDIKYLH